MPEKPSYAPEYRREQVILVRQTCLYVATKLGDLLDDLVVVGGLVPSLLIPKKSLSTDVDPHIGTMDLDLGLTLSLLEDERYENFTERLRGAGFGPDTNEEGNLTFQRWKIEVSGDMKVTVDFVIPPSLADDEGGKLRHIEQDFAAVITPGLQLAFRDRQKIGIEGITILGAKASREMWVCGPGAFAVLKALAFGTRAEKKDAYDLYYLIRNYGNGVEDIFKCLAPLLNDQDAQRALEILKRDFSDMDNIGPVAVAEFLYRERNDDLQAEVVGFIRDLLGKCQII
jgi:hypothetical protein